MSYLAAGEAPLQMIEGQIYLNYNNPNLQFRTFSEGTPMESNRHRELPCRCSSRC